MHGLGNDFVILDGRAEPVSLMPQQIRHLADRREGIGCDQLIIMEPAAQADVFMRIHNADGGEVGACGNATRCVARLVIDQTGEGHITIETTAGILHAQDTESGDIAVDMGKPRFAWKEIPLAEVCDTLHLPVASGSLSDGVAVNIGNPHAVFFVDDTETISLREHGSALEHHPLFPEHANINVAQIVDDHTLKLRVWERGVGETQACGTGACATTVAAIRRGLCADHVNVHLPGGVLHIVWQEGQSVTMTGSASFSFEGNVTL